MGDMLSLDGRDSVRPVMQWSAGRNGGFSPAPAKELIRPVIRRGPYGYRAVNVADQQQDPGSLLSWMERLFRLRREAPEIGLGEWTLIDTGQSSVLALRYEYRGSVVVTLHNLVPRRTMVTLRLDPGEVAHLDDLMANKRYRSDRDGNHEVELDAYGYRWFRRGEAREE